MATDTKGIPGTIYLIHIDEPVGSGAQHYCGWSSDADKRFEVHAKGRGGRLLRAARNAGVAFRIIRRWEGLTRADERRMKKTGSLAALCPVCRDEHLRRRNEAQRNRRARDGRADRPRKNPRGLK